MGHKQAKSQFRRRIAVGAVFATGLLGVGMPAASAHTADLKVSSVCQDNGTRLVTYTGETKNVPSEGDGHVATLTVTGIVPTGTTASPSTQTVTGNETYTFTQTISGSAKTAKATAHLVWGDEVTADPTGEANFTEDCALIAPAKPAPVVVVTASDAKDCAARTVKTTTVTTTTDWVLVDNVWVKDTPMVTQKVTDRAATARECPIIAPAKPAPVVVVTASDAKDCAARTVKTTTVTTTTDWVLVENVWVKDTPVVTQNVTDRAATAQECPISDLGVKPVAAVIAGPVTPAAANPLPVAASAGEVSTSGQLYAGGLTAFAAFIALGASFVLRRRHGEE